MLVTRNLGDWNTVVGEVAWNSIGKTTMDYHSKLIPLNVIAIMAHFLFFHNMYHVDYNAL